MSIEYRGHTFPGYNKPIRNTGSGKHKKMVLAKQGDKVRLIRFGHKGYGHNINPKRKANYLKRSAGIRDKSGRLTKDNKLSANYWARKTLWPANKPTMAEKRANLNLLKTYRNDIGGALGGSVLGGAVGYKSGYTDKDGRSNRFKRSLMGAAAGGLTGLGFGRMSRRLGESGKRVSELQERMTNASQEHVARINQLTDANTKKMQRLREQLESDHGVALSKQQQEFSDLTHKFDARGTELDDANTNINRLKRELKDEQTRRQEVEGAKIRLEQERSKYLRAEDERFLESRARRLDLKRRVGETDLEFEDRIEAAEKEKSRRNMARIEREEALADLPDVRFRDFVGTARKLRE